MKGDESEGSLAGSGLSCGDENEEGWVNRGENG